jgi:glycosyltransferase involved in cell wall biosynthesis
VKYKVRTYSVNGSNRVHYSGAIVYDRDFLPGQSEKLADLGFLERINFEPLPKIKVAVIIPTIPGRELFVNNCLRLLANQTMQPDITEIVNYPAKDYPDTTDRYFYGLEKVFKQGAEVAVCFEDDDWYHPSYIETMVKGWHEAKRPILYGINHSTYYHIKVKKYFKISHKGRASMMSTLISNKFKKDMVVIQDKNQYLDSHIWGQIKGVDFTSSQMLCMGIKHGMTKVAGGAHNGNSPHYKYPDDSLKFLMETTKKDFMFYYTLSQLQNYDISSEGWQTNNTELTIITRKHGDKRPISYKKHRESMLKLKGKFQQIKIVDKVGLGMLAANSSFQLAVPHIKGKWVYLLDDDDGIIDHDVIEKLQSYNTDIVICKGEINGRIYPPENLWKQRPVRAGIGGSCIFVKREIFNRHIIHFAHKQMGDFEFINHLFNIGVSVSWLDSVVMKTFKVSRGAVE